MGVQDTGCLSHAPKGHGVVRATNGMCHYYQDNYHIRPNFRMKEFNTEHIHPYGIMEKLVNQLQTMRYYLGVPIIITSGYRRESNTHGSGLAADVWVPNKTFIQVAEAAYHAGFRRIEVMKHRGTSYWNHMSVGGHVHVDVYDGTGNNTSGSIYDCPSCNIIPCYPWYAWGIQGSWWAISQPNTFGKLLENLKNDVGNTGHHRC